MITSKVIYFLKTIWKLFLRLTNNLVFYYHLKYRYNVVVPIKLKINKKFYKYLRGGYERV